MADKLPAGPYRDIVLEDGTKVPWYMIPFDKKGRCQGPKTREALLKDSAGGSYTDIYVFSHGWNNDWAAATGRYEHFITGYGKLRRDRKLDLKRPYRPLVVGLFWPSAVLVKEREQAPQIAAGGPSARQDQEIALERRQIHEIAEDLPESSVERFYAIAQQETVTEAEALELAKMLRPLEQDEIEAQPASRESLVQGWKELGAVEEETASDDFGTVEHGVSEPVAAGTVVKAGAMKLRDILRAFTVWQMKDRAGVVGAKGGAPLLSDLLKSSQAKIHLIGHSYGAKVVLSSVAAIAQMPRSVSSVLLLQPAISHLCFANQVPGTQKAGGYREVLRRVDKPVLSTFSANDDPLTKFFHLALRRSGDLGEARIAGPGDPPSVYAALGGFGPRGAGERLIDIQDPEQAYDLGPQAPRIYGLRGTRTIGDHGDISNESTWWALYSLVAS